MQQLEQRGFEIGEREGRLKAIVEVILEAKLEGKREEKLKIAEALLKEGQQIDLVEKITKLTRQDILALEKKISYRN